MKDTKHSVISRRASRISPNYLECLGGFPTLDKVPAGVRITLRTEFSFFRQLVYTGYAWNAIRMSKRLPINITSDKKSSNMVIETLGRHTTDRSTLMKPVVRLSYRKWGKSRNTSRFLDMADILWSVFLLYWLHQCLTFCARDTLGIIVFYSQCVSKQFNLLSENVHVS